MAQWFDITSPGGDISILMSAWGLSYDPGDPHQQDYQAAINAARPYGGKGPYRPGGNWDLFAEMCLRTRTLIYAETKIGDCGGGTTGGGGVSGVTVAESIANNVAQSIPVVGSIVGGIEDIFGVFGAAHAQAVAVETATLCGAVASIGPQVYAVYSGLASGSITASQAIADMQALAQSFHQKWVAAGVKVISCNDACGMDAIMQAHITLIKTLAQEQQSNPVASISSMASGVFNYLPWWVWAAAIALILFLLTNSKGKT